ncbi:MAG TPA: hypothetical protein VNJ05_04845 [Sphingomicrobium sp.]|nr:hypothetical protein [Sphingomicrobium sp.]
MSKLQHVKFAALALVLAAPSLLAPQPALAQDRIREIEVFGTDPCPRSTDDEVVVCARKPESERYRIPERLRESGPRQTRESWANKAIAFETQLGNGLNSCSPVGPAGFTGCHQQLINQAFRERREEEKAAGVPEE